MKLTKSHHHRKQKNRSCNRGFRTGSWFAFVAHWYWQSFSSSGKKNKQKTKTEMNLNPFRDEWLNAAEGFMYREDGIWFSRRQDLWDKIRSLLSFHSSDLKRHFPPTIFITLRLILEYMSEHMDARYSHLFPSMSTHCFQQWRILKGNPKRNHLMTTQMLTQHLNRGRISHLMAYTLSAKKQQYSSYRSILMIHAAASWETIKTIDGYFLTSLIKMIKLN